MSFSYINGSYTNNIDAQISVEDRGFNFSDGQEIDESPPEANASLLASKF